ncbi:hypothetical protein QCA50_015733 [Cerrena zonata]|uniref:Glycylpeptide N-tetradecanoyltransferase n=1 Tax=Cerrena zonata TaxID=2478898 RepID=A0AAW0FJ68_9APHY
MGEQLNDSQKKQMKDYKFWSTQPVPRLNEEIDSEGPIEVKKPQDVPDDPLPLLKDFEWSTVDVEDSNQLEEVYNLLYENYVEDQDATFRFKYSHEFFKWALKPPGWRKDWHVGVRVKETDNPSYNELGIAYLFYYASESAFGDDVEGYKSRLNSLINDALITSKQYNVDVFNALTSQDNPYFIKSSKFGSGDGLLNYYLFNYKTWPINGGIDSQTKEVIDDKSSGLGVVLL